MKKIKIIGLNVGAGKDSVTGRGFFNSKDQTFSYIPIEETQKQRIKFTFRDLNNPYLKEALDVPCHYDPEFDTYTYGHVKRGFGDNILYELDPFRSNVSLFFYATLNIDNDPNKWGVFIIGFFDVQKIVDVREYSKERIFSLTDFKNNAHLRRGEPGVDLLIKGTPNSKLFNRALPLSDLSNLKQLDARFSDLITTVSGKKITKNNSWHRWVLYSESQALLDIFNEHVKAETKEYFKKEYAWVTRDIEKLISKGDAVKLHNSSIHDSIVDFFEKMKKNYPKLFKYLDEGDISFLMLGVALDEIGEIEE